MEQGVGGQQTSQSSALQGKRPQAKIAIGTLKGKEKEITQQQQETLKQIEEKLKAQIENADEQQKIYLQQDLDAINILKQNAEITSEQVLYEDLDIHILIKTLTEKWKSIFSENNNTFQVYIAQIPEKIRVSTELFKYMLSTMAFIAAKHSKNSKIVFKLNVITNPLNTKSMYVQVQLNFISDDLDKQQLQFYLGYYITKENLQDFETQASQISPGFLGFATALNLVYGQVQKATITKNSEGKDEVELFMRIEIPAVQSQVNQAEAQKLTISTQSELVIEKCSVEEASPIVIQDQSEEEVKQEL